MLCLIMLVSGGSTVVKHLPRYSKVEGSSPSAYNCTNLITAVKSLLVHAPHIIIRGRIHNTSFYW